jgi:hypothetical protein
LDKPVLDVFGWIFFVFAGIFDLGSTAIQTSQKGIEGSNVGRSTIRRKGNGSVNDDEDEKKNDDEL